MSKAARTVISCDDIPKFEEIERLTLDERKDIMIVREGRSEGAPIELLLRNIFVHAILTRSSDIHIDAHGDRQAPSIHIGIRTPAKGLVNMVYRGAHGRHFEAKLFQLTNTPQGGSTPEMLATRFSMQLPASFARRHGLACRLDADGVEKPYLVDIRVSYIKTYDGFAFVCRLLDQQRTPRLHELGLCYTMQRSILRAIREPSGLILVSGPTGSGKTTLLYAILDRLNDGTRTITTLENPVELKMEGDGPIKQIQIQGDITFPRALRTILRQDPEIILVGEIRDSETMEIALQAAQTGHLVFATLHANSGPETLSRALDLTVDKRRDAFRLAETVKFVMAQRLVTRYEGVCVHRRLAQDERGWFEANGLGFMETIAEVQGETRQGKAALIEAFTMSAGIKAAVRGEGLNSAEIYRLACEQPQYETLAMAGVRAVQGLGCRVADCMTGLETTTEAADVPGLRARLSRDHHLTLFQVADAIDAQCKAEDAGDYQPVEYFAAQVKAAAGAAQTAQRVASQEL